MIDAVVRGDAAAVEALLAGGADVNARGPDGATALMAAVLWGHAKVVDLLLQHGADPDLTDAEGWDARRLAEVRGDREIRQKLS